MIQRIIYSFLISATILIFTRDANALSPTPTPKKSQNSTNSASPTNIDVISDLKERIASKVASLKLVERRGIVGTANAITNSQITISDVKGNTRLIDVDELTRFASVSAKESFGISDITKGMKISVLGLYNKQSRRLLARFIDSVIMPISIQGAVLDVDKENFTIEILSQNSEKTTVDIEKITKTYSYTKDAGEEKSGFSKTKVGQRVFVVGFKDSKEKNRMTGLRIIVFPEIMPNPSIKLSPTVEKKSITVTPAETKPSTGSGKKLTPIKN